MTKIKPSHWFDKDIYTLGEACPSKHYWGTSEFSLRVIEGGYCVQCSGKGKVTKPLKHNEPEAKEQFMSKVKKTAGCWIWVKDRNVKKHSSFGSSVETEYRYGMFSYKGSWAAAHRVAYLMFIGEIPPRKVVKHRCGQSLCVNPSHLYLADPIQNLQNLELGT